MNGDDTQKNLKKNYCREPVRLRGRRPLYGILQCAPWEFTSNDLYRLIIFFFAIFVLYGFLSTFEASLNFILLFLLAGLVFYFPAVVVSYLLGWFKKAQIKNKKKENPSSPWLWDFDWKEDRIFGWMGKYIAQETVGLLFSCLFVGLFAYVLIFEFDKMILRGKIIFSGAIFLIFYFGILPKKKFFFTCFSISNIKRAN